jgi:hypothetical protein
MWQRGFTGNQGLSGRLTPVWQGSTLVNGEEAMKKTALISLLVVAVLLASSLSSFAWSRGGGRPGGFHHGGFRGHGVVVGPGWGWGWGPYWGWGWAGGYYPPPYYYPYYAQPQVVVQPAPVYVEGSTSSPSAAEPAEGYWYYCPGSKAYYPNVPSCNEAWVKVPPRSE